MRQLEIDGETWDALQPAQMADQGDWWRLDGWGPTGRPLFGCELDPATLGRPMEIERVARLSHPALPRLVAASPLAMVIEAVDGVSVDKLMAQRAAGELNLTPGAVIDFAMQLVDALFHLHRVGRSHGHLSPGHIVLDPSGVVGIQGITDGHYAEVSLAWMPPDISQANKQDDLADQWAIGAIVASLITGRGPWDPGQEEEMAAAGEISHLIQPVIDQWPALGRLLQRMTNPNRRARYDSLRPVGNGLKALSERLGSEEDLPQIAYELHLAERPPVAEVVLEDEPQTVVDDPTAPSQGPPPHPEDELYEEPSRDDPSIGELEIDDLEGAFAEVEYVPTYGGEPSSPSISLETPTILPHTGAGVDTMERPSVVPEALGVTPATVAEAWTAPPATVAELTRILPPTRIKPPSSSWDRPLILKVAPYTVVGFGIVVLASLLW